MQIKGYIFLFIAGTFKYNWLHFFLDKFLTPDEQFLIKNTRGIDSNSRNSSNVKGIYAIISLIISLFGLSGSAIKCAQYNYPDLNFPC